MGTFSLSAIFILFQVHCISCIVFDTFFVLVVFDVAVVIIVPVSAIVIVNDAT